MKLPEIIIINTSGKDDLRFAGPVKEIVTDMVGKINIIHWSELTGLSELGYLKPVIISASPRGDNANFSERLTAFKWLKSHGEPVLGICAGHQFMGVSFGADLIPGSEAEEGSCEVEIIKDDPVLGNSGRKIQVRQNHDDAISLPGNFHLLASSDNCKVQAMRHKELSFYGVQWHAEISNPDIIRRFAMFFLKE